jgi:hypothetical protein
MGSTSGSASLFCRPYQFVIRTGSAYSLNLGPVAKRDSVSNVIAFRPRLTPPDLVTVDVALIGMSPPAADPLAMVYRAGPVPPGVDWVVSGRMGILAVSRGPVALAITRPGEDLERAHLRLRTWARERFVERVPDQVPCDLLFSPGGGCMAVVAAPRLDRISLSTQWRG